MGRGASFDQRSAGHLDSLGAEPRTFRLGIISDTHGSLRPEALRLLDGVGHIVHGSDIGDPDIIGTLRRLAPVTAIRGNVDTGDWAGAYAERRPSRPAEGGSISG